MRLTALAEHDTQEELEQTGEGPTPDSTIGRIALKQVRVSRAEAEARMRETDGGAKKPVPTNSNSPLNRLVPYLDLFGRLSDEELSRLARTPTSAVETLRQQVDEVNRALARYVDLLARLSDDELVRLTGATPKTVRFWRLCQPRGEARSRGGDVPQPMVRESSAVRSVARDLDEGSSSERMQVGEVKEQGTSAVPSHVEPIGSGTMVVDDELAARLTREL
jgi:hypothetical protein